MPPVIAAVGVAAAGAVSAVGAGLAALTLAEGVILAGAALSTIGTITKSPTLTKVGAGLTLAGGVGSIAGKSSKPSSVTGSNASKSTSLLESDNIDDILATQTKGAASAADLSQFTPTGAATDSVDAFKSASDSIGVGADNFNPQQSFLSRTNNTLAKYSPITNILGGAADAYMQNNFIESREDMQKRALDFEQKEIDRRNENLNGQPGSSSQIRVPRISVNPSAYTGILRRQ